MLLKRLAWLAIIMGVLWAGYWLVTGIKDVILAVQPPAGFEQSGISDFQWGMVRFFIQAAAANALYGVLMIVGGVFLLRWARRRQPVIGNLVTNPKE